MNTCSSSRRDPASSCCSSFRAIRRWNYLPDFDFSLVGVRSAFVRTCRSFFLFECLAGCSDRTGYPVSSTCQETLDVPLGWRVGWQLRLSNYQRGLAHGSRAAARLLLMLSQASQSSYAFECRSLSSSHSRLQTSHVGTCTSVVVCCALLSSQMFVSILLTGLSSLWFGSGAQQALIKSLLFLPSFDSPASINLPYCSLFLRLILCWLSVPQ